MKRKVTPRIAAILGAVLKIWIYRSRKYSDTRNNMVKHNHIILLTILFILLSGCVSNNTAYVGTYYKDQSNYITLNSDGTFIVTQDPMEGGGFIGTFKVNTDKTGVMTIFLKFADGDSMMTIVNKTVLVDRQGDKWTKG